MAGFQQAANAIVGAPGQVMKATGIYNELVGKNEELIKELVDKSDELEKKNEDITEKNKTIRSQYKDLEKKNEELRYTNMQLNETINTCSSIAQDYVRISKMAGRVEAHERAVASRNKMLDNLYDPIKHNTAGPTGEYHEGGR